MNNPDMADIGEKYKTKPKETFIKKSRRSVFKKNVPKKLRNEWGERMSFFRSL